MLKSKKKNSVLFIFIFWCVLAISSLEIGEQVIYRYTAVSL